MSKSLTFILFLFTLILFLIVSRIVRKGKMPVKYAISWYFIVVVLFITSCFPNLLSKITSIFGFVASSSLVIGIMITMLLFITMVLTIIVSNQSKKIKLLIQEVSLLKNKEK